MSAREVLSDISIAVSATQTDAATLRQHVDWVAGLGVGGVQLDAATPGLRPRELGRSARRDLAAVLRRAELVCTGLDLWIPPYHFASTEHADRAIDAVRSACGLAADLAAMTSAKSPAVSIELPAEPSASLVAAIRAAAEVFGVRVVNYSVSSGSVSAGEEPVGVDPAACLAVGVDPVERLASFALRGYVATRLSDWDGVRRVPVGARGGRLEIEPYLAAARLPAQLSTSAAMVHETCIVIDTRGLDHPRAGGEVAVEVVRRSSETPG